MCISSNSVQEKNTCNKCFSSAAGRSLSMKILHPASSPTDRQTLTLGEQISLCPFSLSASDSSASATGLSSLVPGSAVTCCIISSVSSLSFFAVLTHCTSSWQSGRGSLWCTVLNWIWAERQYSSNPYRYLRFKSKDKQCYILLGMGIVKVLTVLLLLSILLIGPVL